MLDVIDTVAPEKTVAIVWLFVKLWLYPIGNESEAGSEFCG